MIKSAALLIGLALFSALPDAHAFPQPPDSSHFCVTFDYEQWRRDNPRPAAKRLADLNAGEPRTVRMIYFLPNDRPFRAEVVQRMKDQIRKIQDFYGEQMQANGHGEKTFRYETDDQGEPLVHRVDGQHPDSHYLWDTLVTVLEEIDGIFDLERNIYFVVIDNSSNDGIGGGGGTNVRGIASPWGKNGGICLFPEEFSFNTAAHELGHAFGLMHNFRDNEFIMSYGDPSLPRLSACSARFLAVHPLFDSAIPIEQESPPIVELLSPTDYPAGSESVPIQLKLSDSQGLHQVFLLAPSGNHEVWGCRNLTAKEEEVEFRYDGYSPYFDADYGIITRLPLRSEYQMRVIAVDNEGNAADVDIVLQEVSPHLTATLNAHTEGDLRVAFSPDGKTLASVSSSVSGGDRDVILWDVAAQAQVGKLTGHTEAASTVAFSPDGRMIAAGSRDGSVRLWDVETRTEITVLKGHTYLVGPVAFSPDGKTLASSGPVEPDVATILWDLETRKEIAALKGHDLYISAIAFSPDGKTFASGSGDETIKLWDVETRELVTTLEGHDGQVGSLAFSRNGTTLASASSDGRVLLWDVETRTEIGTLLEEDWAIYSIAFSPDGTMLACHSGDTVKLWNLATETEIAVLAHPSSLRSVAFSPDGRTLASGVWDGRILLWDLSEWTRPRPWRLEIISGDGQQGAPGSGLAHPLVVEVRDQYGDPLPGAPVTFAVTVGDGKLSDRFTVEHTTTDANARAELTFTLGSRPGTNIVEASIGPRELARFHAEGVGTAVAVLEGDYRSWHLPDAATVRLGKGAIGEGDRAVALSTDGRCLAVASAIGVWLYEAATSRALDLLPSEPKVPVYSVTFSLDGTLAAGLDNGQVELWEVETGTRTASLRHADWGPVTVAFSPDGTTLVSGSEHQIIKVWDVETMRLVGTWEVEDSDNYWRDIPEVAFSPDGTRLLSGFRDGTVRLWDVATQTEVATLVKGDTDPVVSVSFSPDGTLLASAGGANPFTDPLSRLTDQTVKLWDLATQSQVATLGRAIAVSFSPAGDLLASGSWDGGGTVELWDVANRTLIRTLEGHKGPVHSVTFSPDGAILVSAASDGTVLLRELETGNAAVVSGHNYSSAMAFSPDGTLLATGSWERDPTVKLWDVATQSQVATLEWGSTLAVSFSPAGDLLASVSDGTVKLWDVATQSQVAALRGHPSGVRAVSFSPDGVLLASGSWDGTVRLFDVGTRGQTGILEGHRGVVLSVAFSPDGAILASTGGYEDNTVKLWNVATQELIATLEGHENAVNAVAFSPDGNTLAYGSDGIQMWNLATRTHIASLEESFGSIALAFSPDGTTLVSGSWGGTVKLWDVATKEPVSTLEGHASRVHSVAFAHDGTTLASGSDDGTILLWDLQLLQPRPHTLTKVAGDKQQGPAGAALAKPFVVWVRDQHGNLFAGAAVTFAVTAGDGTLSVSTVTTDANGRVESILTLGSQPGPNTVEVTVDDLEPLVFTATGQAVPQTLAKVSGDEQQGPPGAALAAPFVVSVLDQNETALAGAAVTFAITAGGGTLSTTTATTDADGRAAATLTLGSDPGTHTVEATVAGLEPVIFTAVAEATPDFDGDGETGFSDFFLFAEAFGGSDPRFDLDGDGSVGFADFFLLSDHFADPARGKLLALARELIGLPDGPQLRQNAPNPFNSDTVISWFLLRPGPARVEVFALTGQRVAVLHEGPEKAGVHRVNWNGRDGAGRPLASGVYLYRLVTEERVHTRKLTLLR